MKNFTQYLFESQRTYRYRIKIAGEIKPEFMSGLREKMAQFDPVKIGEVRTTPIQKVATDFPNFENDRVSFFDVEFRYPAIHPQVTSMAQMLGLDPNRLIMTTIGHDDADIEEYDEIQAQNQNLLADPEFPAPNKEQRRLKKDYSADPYDHEVLQNQYRTNFKVAGGKTPRAQTTNELPMGDKSPIGGKNKLPKVTSNAR